MSEYDKNALLASLKLGEGNKLQVYDDATGKLVGPGSTLVGHPTVGIGIALDVGGLTNEESEYLALNKAAAADAHLETSYPWYPGVSEPRRRVFIEMVYNMGPAHFAGFHDMIAAAEIGDFEAVVNEMLDSTWSKQVGNRAVRLAGVMRAGA